MKSLTLKARLGLFSLSLFSALSAVADSPSIAVPLADVAEHPLRRAPATALSLNNSLLSAQIQATVDSIAVGVSQAVKKGDTLMALDCTDYKLQLANAKAAVEVAEARLTLAKSQRQRSTALLKKQVTSQEAADTTAVEAVARAAELQQAKLALQQAQIDQERCVIKAPFDGIITERLIGEGQLASVGTALLAITETDRIELAALVKPDEIRQLKAASQLTFDAAEDYPVTVLRWGGAVNTETRNLEIRLQFTDAKPPPGTAGTLVWRDPRFFVPAKYVVTRGLNLGIFTAQEGFAEFYPLPDAVPGRAAAVDLPPFTPLITENLGQIKAGDKL